MTDQLTRRMNQILPKVTSAEFLSGSGLGNEIAFHIFDYPPEDELWVREHVKHLLEHIPRRKPELKVAYVNLFDFLLDYLKERKLLDSAFKMQKDKGDEALLKALKGVLSEEKLSKRFAELVKPEEHGLVIIEGVGSVYPLIRSHVLLNNLHSVMGLTPLLMFYPGKYDRASLRLFGKRSTTGHVDSGEHKQVNYYRAFRLVD